MDKSFTTIIGKDVIESLTLSMYEDSKFIFREYIQNAADQIDKAEKEQMLKSGEGEIHVVIDKENKIISIEDNATGIAADDVLDKLKNIAQSTKKRGEDKGFRGIGRLGGLGYCDTLIFETSYPGETKKSTMTWNAKLFKEIINNRSKKEEATDVMDTITSLDVADELSNNHYFKVTMEGVSNEELLDVANVRKYLSMIAPVPFPAKFLYRKKIYDELQADNISIDEYNIFINTEQLYKGYSTSIYDGDDENKKQIGEIIDVLFFKEKDKNNSFFYWGWYGITEKTQSINPVNYARGFRLRKSNIAVGDESTLTKLHRDRRFQFYFIGEIHALSKDLIPNARRDYFSENDSCLELEHKLRMFFHTTIHKLCYTASEINSSIRKIENYKNLQKEFETKVQEGFTDKAEHEEYQGKLAQKKDEAVKAENKIEKIYTTSSNGVSSPITKILDKVAETKSVKVDFFDNSIQQVKFKLRTDNLDKLNKGQRTFLGDIFRIIKNVLPNEVAENLIKKIEEELK